MKRIIGSILIIFGLAIIVTEITLQINTKSIEQNSNKKTTNNFVYKTLNNFNQEEVCTTYNLISTYINTNNFDKISFNYPDCVHEYELSHWTKNLVSEDKNVNIIINKINNNIEEYIKEKENLLKTELKYVNNEHSQVQNLINENDIEISFFEVNYKDIDIKDTYYDVWFIAAKIDENNILTFEITSVNKVIAYDAIHSMLNSLTISKNQAVITNTKVDDKYQIGTLSQNSESSYEHGYKVNLKIPQKYSEIKSYTTDFDQSTFEYKKNEEKVYVKMTLSKDNFHTITDKIDLIHQMLIDNYKTGESYINIVDSDVIEKIINDKKIYYIIFSYFDPDKKINNYISYIYYELGPGFYYEIYINNDNVKIDEEFITQFLDFTVEQY